jgi:hypothetical protein
MKTEIVLRIFDGEERCQASRGILFDEEHWKPVPVAGDSITLMVHDVIYRGSVISRHFDYSEVQQENPDAILRITVDAREG